jgi:flagellar biosynthesis protein FlhB
VADEAEKDEKTEAATEHRLDQMREEGKAPRSADIGAAVVMLAGVAAVSVAGHHAVVSSLALARRALSLRDIHQPMSLVFEVMRLFVTTALPVAFVIGLAALIAGLVQSRGLIAWGELAFKPERLDPLEGIKRVLPSRDVAIELGKTLLKVVLIGYVAYQVLESAMPQLIVLARSPAQSSAREVVSVLGDLALRSMVAFAVLAGVDYFLAVRKFQDDAKMTKQEVKDEYKEQEGDPHVKGKRRARARQMAKQRTLQETASATVLVTNPTHIAVALRYEPGQDAAPMVVAMGTDELALRMREEARKHKVPIVENRPLARTMHKSAKVGRPIPIDVYEPVAQIIAHVFRIRSRS